MDVVVDGVGDGDGCLVGDAVDLESYGGAAVEIGELVGVFELVGDLCDLSEQYGGAISS